MTIYMKPEVQIDTHYYKVLNIKNLNNFKERLDPRLYNGAIFIGLDSPVVKSHGGTDYLGFSNSLDVCKRIVKGDLRQA